MQLNNKKAVIFDMDGTLIDSMWVWAAIDKEFLGKRGFICTPEIQHDVEGMSFHETARYFKERFHLPEDLQTIMDTWNDMAYDKYEHEVMLKPGVREFLEYLRKKNIKMGISTSNAPKLVHLCLRALGIDDYFGAVTTAAEISQGKPNPDIYLLTAKKLDVNPCDCLVFEDVPNGILAGKRAGMEVCAVDDETSRHLNDQKKGLADYFINSFTELEVWYD